MEHNDSSYKKATDRVKQLKGFYRHIKVFIVVNALLYLIKSGVLRPILPDGFPSEHYYFDWIDLNLVIWLFILAVHAVILFRNKLPFLKNWETRQIQKYLDEEKNDSQKRYR
ncbi:MAG: 2TM domain-containing protein [Allomuricauda sp.]